MCIRAYWGDVPGGSGLASSASVDSFAIVVLLVRQSVKISRLTVCRYGIETKGVMYKMS